MKRSLRTHVAVAMIVIMIVTVVVPFAFVDLAPDVSMNVIDKLDKFRGVLDRTTLGTDLSDLVHESLEFIYTAIDLVECLAMESNGLVPVLVVFIVRVVFIVLFVLVTFFVLLMVLVFLMLVALFVFGLDQHEVFERNDLCEEFRDWNGRFPGSATIHRSADTHQNQCNRQVREFSCFHGYIVPPSITKNPLVLGENGVRLRVSTVHPARLEPSVLLSFAPRGLPP